MKKLLASVVIAALLVANLGLAAAAPLTDVAGTKYEQSVMTLNSLGLLTGFPDGTFRADETVTRAQFATISVRMLGLEGAAAFAKGATRFPDVAATHWASGHINIAVDQGIIGGYPDGTFKPEAPVTCAEALAMLIRVLGYEPSVRGTWPTNYLVKAFEIGLSRGVEHSASVPASRGIVALFMDKALEINLMKPTSVGDVTTYVISTDTLLDDKLGFTALAEVVNDTGDMFGSLLKANEVLIGTKKLTLAEGLNISDLLGYKVKAWYDGTGTLAVVRVLTAGDRVVEGKVASKTATTVKVGTKTYTLGTNPVVFWNMVDGGQPGDANWAGANVKLFLDATGKVDFIIGLKFDGSLVLTEVSERFGRIKGATTALGTKQLRESVYDGVVIVKGGEEVELGDLAVNDVVHYFEVNAGGDDYLYILAVDDKVAGEAEEVFVNASGTIVIVVDGTEYVCTTSTLSPNDNVSFLTLDEANLVAYVGEEVELYLDREGKVRHVVAEIEAPPVAVWGIVTTAPYTWGPAADLEYFIKIRMADTGTIVKYQFLTTAVWSVLDAANQGAASTLYTDVAVGDVVKVELKSDGMLKKVTEPAFNPVGNTLDVAAAVWTRNKANSLLTEVGVKTYKLTSSTLVFDYDNNKLLTADHFLTGTIQAGGAGFDLSVGADGVTVAAIRVAGNQLVTAADQLIGVVTGRYVTSDGTRVKILVKDETYDYVGTGAVVTSFKASNARDANAANDQDILTQIAARDLVRFTYAGTAYGEIEELRAYSAGTAAATATIGSGTDGTVTVTVDVKGADGNDFTIEVVEGVGANVAMGVVFAAGKITVTLGTDAGSALDPAKNTATLVAAAIDAQAGVSAVASGTGADSLTAAEAETSFAGGKSAHAFYVYSYSASTGILKVMSTLDAGAPEATFLLTTATVIYDCTGTPVMVDDGELFEDVKIQLFTNGSLVTFIKLVN